MSDNLSLETIVAPAACAVTELRTPAEPRYLELVERFVDFAAQSMGFPEQQAARLRLAVDEGCANALTHGGLVAGRDTLLVTCETTADRLVVRIVDHGPLFDPARLPKPKLDAPLEKRKIGGLGLHLIGEMVDEVAVEPHAEGKALVLTKRMTSKGAPDDEG